MLRVEQKKFVYYLHKVLCQTTSYKSNVKHEKVTYFILVNEHRGLSFLFLWQNFVRNLMVRVRSCCDKILFCIRYTSMDTIGQLICVKHNKSLPVRCHWIKIELFFLCERRILFIQEWPFSLVTFFATPAFTFSIMFIIFLANYY